MKHIALFIGSILLTTACGGVAEDATLGESGKATSVGGGSSVIAETGGSSTGGSSSVENTGGTLSIDTAGGSSASSGGTVTSNGCRIEKRASVSVYTSYHSVLASSDGFMIYGTVTDPNGNGSNSAELQYWDAKTMTKVSATTVSNYTQLLEGGGSPYGFSVQVIWKPFDPEFNHVYDFELASFGSKGVLQASSNPGWNRQPWYSNVVGMRGGDPGRVIWSDYDSATSHYSLRSVSISDGFMSGPELNYTWTNDDGLSPDGLSAAVTNDSHVLVSASLVGTGASRDELLFWDASVLPSSERYVAVVPAQGSVRDIFPLKDGFDVWYSGTSDTSGKVMRYSVNGTEGRSFDLPRDTSRVTAFQNGFAVITESRDNWKNFQFIRLSEDGEALQTIPFSSEFDPYLLAIGNIEASGNVLAFTWSGLNANPASEIAFFVCGD